MVTSFLIATYDNSRQVNSNLRLYLNTYFMFWKDKKELVKTRTNFDNFYKNLKLTYFFFSYCVISFTANLKFVENYSRSDNIRYVVGKAWKKIWYDFEYFSKLLGRYQFSLLEDFFIGSQKLCLCVKFIKLKMIKKKI